MVKAVRVLKDHNVLEENIVLANLFCTPQATQTIVTAFPQVRPSLQVRISSNRFVSRKTRSFAELSRFSELVGMFIVSYSSFCTRFPFK